VTVIIVWLGPEKGLSRVLLSSSSDVRVVIGKSPKESINIVRQLRVCVHGVAGTFGVTALDFGCLTCSDWLGFFNESEKNRFIDDMSCRVISQQVTEI